MGRSQGKAREIAILGIFTAILILQSVVPFLGYIPLLPGMPVITLSVMTVMVAAAMLGPRDGAILGLIWGVISLIRAYTSPGTVTFLLFANPVIAIVPRLLVGWLTGWLPRVLSKAKLPQPLSYGVSGFLGAALNTFGVITLSSLFYLNHASTLLNQMGFQGDTRNLFVILLTALGVNGLTEALSALFIVPLLGIPLTHVWQRRQG
ncbi:ECF transporter S component [Lapidilactobacillus luobeiensis]|uniref:ECF transporter S component n=1 Tax=Lapidilactobacillus luobeiensis TaxID=2950371 RepID=UPI0021C40388|nr:ECF transporter S component [Lapidilactobacillus luobeiensis]